MSRLTRDGMAEPVSRDQILRHVQGQENMIFPCSADHEQDWQPFLVDPSSAICNDHTYIHTYINVYEYFLMFALILWIAPVVEGIALYCIACSIRSTDDGIV